MVSWYEEEVNLAKKVHNVPVGDLGLKDIDKDGKEKIVETIPVVDLTNKEMTLLQSDPILDKYPGEMTKASSQKAQVFGLLVTYQRMYKANQSLGFGLKDMLQWGSSRTGKLVKRISDHLGEVQKK